MAKSKQLTYMTKTIKFGSNTLKLYSLDGQTWSSRKEELEVIKERHENEKLAIVRLKNNTPANAAAGAKKAEENKKTEPVPIAKAKGLKKEKAVPSSKSKEKAKPALAKTKPAAAAPKKAKSKKAAPKKKAAAGSKAKRKK